LGLWSPTVTIGAETEGRAACFFNRGIVASQWLARLLPQDHPSRKLAKVIASPGDKIRNFLAGPVREKLVSLLTDAKAAKGHNYAALFELGDPELIPLLQGLRKRAHIVLGNGSVKRKGEDENADARSALDVCDVKDRMTAPRALAHNKFLDADKAPQAVWTGSTNWTKTGLCTQANNGLLVRNPSLAQFYLDHSGRHLRRRAIQRHPTYTNQTQRRVLRRATRARRSGSRRCTSLSISNRPGGSLPMRRRATCS
jgi:hypothetical protein